MKNHQPLVKKQTQRRDLAVGQGRSMTVVGAQHSGTHLHASRTSTYNADEVAGDVQQLAPAESGNGLGGYTITDRPGYKAQAAVARE